ncbi:MAG: 7-cyano-7-deazaguanine synthase [Acidobacteria bacterium]|nr:7-cyano-7-deazaguanine synthase [Acidobacteriota bacterium]MCI0723741.1 7-cyano-7-deazaguanine synthase [Acidobacteriota bacterium]
MSFSNGNRVAVLLSGGLDSCVLAADLAARARTVYPVYVRQGLLWESVERHWIDKFLEAVAEPNIKPLREIDLPVTDLYNSHWSTTGESTPGHRSGDHEVYLPGRNLLLLAKTALFCVLNEIPAAALGPLAGNPFPDSTPEFFSKFEEMASLALGFSLRVETPFATLSKAEVIWLGRHLPLELSFSCISPAGLDHCGACNKCAERRKSFQQAGVEDKTRYQSLPPLEDSTLQ